MKEESQEEWNYASQAGAHQTVRVIRPLRDVGVKECAFWAWWSGLRVVGKHRHSGGRQDISALTRGIRNLTIMKTVLTGLFQTSLWA